MRLSIIIPVYNELSTIEEIIRRVRQSAVDDKEIIVVDDFSTDGTRQLLQEHLHQHVDKVLYQPRNMGKGSAVHAGLREVTGDIVLIQDADLEYDPGQYPMLIEPIIKGRAEVVYGSRFMRDGSHPVVSFWHFIGNKLLTILSNMFTNLNLSDVETCYKIFRRELIQSFELKEPRFGFDPEVTARVSQRRVPIYEMGISYNARNYDEGKKIGLKDAIRAIWCIIKYNTWAK